MNEQELTRRIETSLQRGMASVPIPAREPATARYRNRSGRVARRPATRLVVLIAAFGVALLTSLGALAASEPSSVRSARAAVHSIQVLVAHIVGPAGGEPAAIDAHPSTTSVEEEAGPGRSDPQGKTGSDWPALTPESSGSDLATQAAGESPARVSETSVAILPSAASDELRHASPGNTGSPSSDGAPSTASEGLAGGTRAGCAQDDAPCGASPVEAAPVATYSA